MKPPVAIAISVAVLGLPTAAAAPSMSVTKPVADTGSYTGVAAGRAVTFFVAPGSRRVLNLAIPLTGLYCSPGGGGTSDTSFVIAKTAIGLKGAFNVKGAQNGIFGGYPARFSYSFAGRFSKATKLHTGTAAGTFREDIRYTDSSGVHITCSTNRQSWTASRSGPVPTLKSLVRQGHYAGSALGRALSFTVAPSRVNTISIPLTGLYCSPGGGGTSDTTFAIPQATVKGDGSFSAKASQTGVFGGANATFNYVFSGNFQGLNENKVGNVAGVFREDITYTNTAGVHITCTTNTQAWTATRAP
jgi:hypothetical protein